MKTKENSKEKISKKVLEINGQKQCYKENAYRGISLIVLVITIIIVIILAAAVIISLQKNNPMVEASEARIKSDIANMQAIFTNTVGKIMAEKEEVIEIVADKLNEKTNTGKSVVGEAIYKIGGEEVGKIIFDNRQNSEVDYYTGRKLPVYNSETTWYVDEDGILRLQIGEKIYGGEIPEDEEVKVGEIVKEKAKKYIDKDGEKATIPIDFAIVPGKEVIKDGLVISDVGNDTGDIGNQFVWVPVNDMSTFVRENGYYEGNIQTNFPFENFSEPLNYDGITASQGEIDEYNKMKASVEEYKGFYIGRYEMSNDGNNNAQSKKNKMPWTNIKWGNSMTDLNGGIVEEARKMYPELQATKGKVVSTLVYGVAWDETVRFIKKNYPGIERDSTGYGNYEENNNIPTGSKEEYALNNIYDMAGNSWEWTMEAYTTTDRAHCGGGYGYTGLWCPISYRSRYDLTGVFDHIGGRCQLYIK